MGLQPPSSGGMGYARWVVQCGSYRTADPVRHRGRFRPALAARPRSRSAGRYTAWRDRLGAGLGEGAVRRARGPRGAPGLRGRRALADDAAARAAADDGGAALAALPQPLRKVLTGCLVATAMRIRWWQPCPVATAMRIRLVAPERPDRPIPPRRVDQRGVVAPPRRGSLPRLAPGSRRLRACSSAARAVPASAPGYPGKLRTHSYF
jgi:hypothetical protein